MSTTQVPNRLTPNATSAVQRRSVWKHGIAAAVVASLATTILAAITSAAGSRLPATQARASRSLVSRS